LREGAEVEIGNLRGIPERGIRGRRRVEGPQLRVTTLPGCEVEVAADEGQPLAFVGGTLDLA